MAAWWKRTLLLELQVGRYFLPAQYQLLTCFLTSAFVFVRRLAVFTLLLLGLAPSMFVTLTVEQIAASPKLEPVLEG